MVKFYACGVKHCYLQLFRQIMSLATLKYRLDDVCWCFIPRLKVKTNKFKKNSWN